MPDCFRGGAPPRLWADFLSIFLTGAIYSLPRYIASSPQGVCVGLKPEMHLKENMKPLILVAPETQVDLQNRSEEQVLARQNTLGHKKRHAQSSRLRLGAADQPEDQNLLGNYIAHKIFCIGQAMQ